MAYEEIYGSPVSTTDDWQNNPWINNFATRGLLSGVQWLGETLGKPQRALFGTLAGESDAWQNLIPFSDTLGITDPAKAVTGRDLLRQYGAIGQEDNWGNFAGGLALDIVADPLAFVRGPAGALTKAGEQAAKAGTLERSIAGRIGRGQGGWAAITDRPWYVEPFMGKAENAAVLGTGKYGQMAAEGLDKGWDAATRAKIPGTSISPVAWMRSAFEPGAANVTGAAELVPTYGKTYKPVESALKAETSIAVEPLYGLQSQAQRDLMNLGMAAEDASRALADAGASTRELGEIRIRSSVPTTADQLQVLEKYGQDYAGQAAKVIDPAFEASKRVGTDINEFGNVWGHGYVPRSMADAGVNLTQQQMARSELLKNIPGGRVAIDEMLTDPAVSGIYNRKLPGQPFDQQAAEAAKKAAGQKFAAMIEADAQAQLPKKYPIPMMAPDEALKLAQPGGAAELGQEIADMAAKLDPKVAERGYFYNLDLATGARNYGHNLASQTANRSSAIDVLVKEADDFKKLTTASGSMSEVRSLDKALDEIGSGTAKEELARRLGIPEADLATRGVREELVQNLRKEIQGVKPKQSLLGDLTNMFRYGVTVPWPANLVRNWSGELVNQGISGTGAVKGLPDAAKFLMKQIPENTPAYANMQKAYQQAVAHGVVETEQLRQLTGTGVTRAGATAINTMPDFTPKSVASRAKEFFAPVYSEKAREGLGMTPFREVMGSTMPPTTITGKAGQFLADNVIDPIRGYAGAMETAHEFQNNATRLQQFSNLLDEGYSPAAAAERVKVAQRDYANTTPFVQNSLRKYVPFASFSVGNLRTQADLLSREPGRYAAMMHILNSGRQDGGFVPGYASSGTAIPLPGAPEGSQRFLGSLGLTAEDEAISALASLMSGRVEEGVRKVASSSNPAFKTLYEIATGRQVFSGRNLDDLKPGALPSLLLGGDTRAARLASQVLQGTPAARVASTVDRLSDMEKKGPLATLLNLTTGLRSVDVDQGQAAQIAARDTITKLLNASDQYKIRESITVDPKWKGREEEIPNEIKVLMQQYQYLQQQAAKAVKAREKNR